MIEEKNLHQDNAQKIKQKYINKLQGLSNITYSEASSEVIYLEMMAYLSDLMNEYCNGIDLRHEYKFAKLLGLNSKPAVNQKRLVQFKGKGTVYATEELLSNVSPFHLQQDMYLLPPLKNIYHDLDGHHKKINVFLNVKDGCYPMPNDHFQLKLEFAEPLECEKIYSIYFDIQENEGRNQQKSRKFHYSEWHLSYLTPFGIGTIEILEDETYDFLFSGCIRFRLHEVMLDTVINLTFQAMYYDKLPIINQILINTDVVQQMKIYAKTWHDLSNNIDSECYIFKKVKQDRYRKIAFVDIDKTKINEKDYIVVFQSKEVDAFAYTIKGVVKEKIQFAKDVYIASIKIAVKIQEDYHELEICDYWQEHPTKLYGCYLDREDNTLTFGNGKDYLLLPANTKLVFWEFIVYQKKPITTTFMKKEDYEMNVLQEISNFCEGESITQVIMKLPDLFKQSYLAITEQDYITIAKSLPMSRFTLLKYLSEEHLLLYDCGVLMPKSFESYFMDYMNQFSLINNEIKVKQVIYIDVDLIVKTKDSTLTANMLTNAIKPYLNQKQYDTIEKLKRAISVDLAIFDLIMYQDQNELVYFQFMENEMIRIKTLTIQLKN